MRLKTRLIYLYPLDFLVNQKHGYGDVGYTWLGDSQEPADFVLPPPSDPDVPSDVINLDRTLGIMTGIELDDPPQQDNGRIIHTFDIENTELDESHSDGEDE